MQCEYRDNASGRTTAAESIADVWTRDGLDVDFREVDEETWRPLAGWQPYRPGPVVRHAPATVDPAPDEHVPPDAMLEIDRDTMELLGELADLRRENESAVVAAAVACFHAATLPESDPQPTDAPTTPSAGPSHPHRARIRRVPATKETPTMRIAVKSTGGITESFLYVENVEEGVREAARHIAEVYCLPTDIELWSNGPDGGPPRKLAELRFVAVTPAGDVVELG